VRCWRSGSNIAVAIDVFTTSPPAAPPLAGHALFFLLSSVSSVTGSLSLSQETRIRKKNHTRTREREKETNTEEKCEQ